MGKKIAVVLAGCGNKDGTEITEAVSLIVSLSQSDADISFFAPDEEFTPKNFLTNEPIEPKRNVMIEAARISRSRILPISRLDPSKFDGVAMPGGMGAALNFSDWTSKGAQAKVHPELTRVLTAFHKQSKPIAAICIAPVLVACVLGKEKITVTIGNNKETASEIEKTGAIHETCPVDDYITDRLHKIITTPAYMYDDAKPAQVFKGVNGLVREFIEMA